jgi:hypothetical protein
MLIWLALDPAASSFAFISLKEFRVRVGRILRQMTVLELDVADAVHVHVVLRQIEHRHRLSRRGIGGPRRPHDAVVVERHHRDARELVGRHVGRTAPAATTAASALLSSTAAGGRLTGRRCRRLTLREAESSRPDDARCANEKFSAFHR